MASSGLRHDRLQPLGLARHAAWLIAGFLAVPPAAPAKAPAANPAALENITQIIRTLTKDPIVRTGTVGFYLAPLDQADSPLLKQNAGQSFIPASTLKPLTTGTALEILGPDFQFETKLQYIPATGDLIIEGSGDPSLARYGWDSLFNDWTAALQAAGVMEITGRLIADESAWETREIPAGWTWQDMGNYYAPPLTPLCFHDNAFRLYFHLSGNPGDAAGFYDAAPWPADLEIIDHLSIGQPGTGDNAYLSGGPGTRRYTLQGTLAADVDKAFIRGALPDPAYFCVREFTDWLNARELPVHGQPTTTRRALAGRQPPAIPAEGKILIAIHRSRPLREMLPAINHRSLNLDCECLLRTLGKGGAAAGLQVIRDHLAAKNLPLDGYEQTDGCGLSRTNMITPELMARANAAVLTGPHGAVFLDSLPGLGASGSTLHELTASGPATIHAKSGTIERVKGYTGVVTSAAGPRYCFSILINNYDGSFSGAVEPRLDELFEALAQL